MTLCPRHDLCYLLLVDYLTKRNLKMWHTLNRYTLKTLLLRWPRIRFWGKSRIALRYWSRISTIILLVCMVSFAKAQHKAFESGEKLKYLIYYGPIRGGEASLEVRKGKYNEKPVNHLYLNGKTIGLANVLYKVDDTYQSFTNID